MHEQVCLKQKKCKLEDSLHVHFAKEYTSLHILMTVQVLQNFRGDPMQGRRPGRYHHTTFGQPRGLGSRRQVPESSLVDDTNQNRSFQPTGNDRPGRGYASQYGE